MIRFPPHGSVKAFWEQNLLIVLLAESFNESGVFSSCEYVNTVIGTGHRGEWARIEVFENDMVLAPIESHPQILAHLQDSAKKNCKLLCMVGGNSVNQPFLEKLATEAGITFWKGSTLAEAKNFARQYMESSFP